MLKCSKPLTMFGLNVNDIEFKPEFVASNNDDAKYVSCEEFVNRCLHDPIISYAYAEVPENNRIIYIGILAGHSWLPMRQNFNNTFDAAEYIANKLFPYCKSTKDWIRTCCHYIENVHTDIRQSEVNDPPPSAFGA